MPLAVALSLSSAIAALVANDCEQVTREAFRSSLVAIYSILVYCTFPIHFCIIYILYICYVEVI